MHLYIILAVYSNQQPIQKMKGDGRYGVHKMGTVQDFLLQKFTKFELAQKRSKKAKFQNKRSVHICIILAVHSNQQSIQKGKGDGSYGVHKVGTFDKIFLQKSLSFNWLRKGKNRSKFKINGSVHNYIMSAIHSNQEPIKKVKGNGRYGVHKMGTVNC